MAIYGDDTPNVLKGSAGDDVIYALGGDDTLYGYDGNDTLNGGTGNDTMLGGAGNDIYAVDSAGDTIVEAMGAGTDRINASVSYTLAANLENLYLYGTATTGTGNALNNGIYGNGNANTLNGLGGDDTLYGYDGNDTLNGGTGSDCMAGGGGNDTYFVDHWSDTIIEDVSAGTDTINAYCSVYSLNTNVEKLYLYGAATTGTGNGLDNMIVGNSNANMLYGYDGADTLNGGSGDDYMVGGTGNDTYVVDSVNDVTVEGAGAGSDRVNAYSSCALYNNVESLYLYGAATSGTGNDLVNAIYGNGNANTLNGLGGDDTLYGYHGNDTLNGGSGNDYMAGGGGNDTYCIDSAGDLVVEVPGAGTDRVNADANYTLSDNVENLYLYGAAFTGAGNAFHNEIYGNSNDNTLDGGAGNDSMYGGAGNDTYCIDSAGDLVVEAPDAGTDRVNAYTSYTLRLNVEDLYLFGAASEGTGNAHDNIIVGTSSGNHLDGLDGDDTLDGGAGNDTMAGGAGSDTYVIDSAGDVVVEAVNEGTDSVNAYVNYALGDNVETLYLFGTALAGYGNALDNLLYGNAYDNCAFRPWRTLVPVMADTIGA